MFNIFNLISYHPPPIPVFLLKNITTVWRGTARIRIPSFCHYCERSRFDKLSFLRPVMFQCQTIAIMENPFAIKGSFSSCFYCEKKFLFFQAYEDKCTFHSISFIVWLYYCTPSIFICAFESNIVPFKKAFWCITVNCVIFYKREMYYWQLSDDFSQFTFIQKRREKHQMTPPDVLR